MGRDGANARRAARLRVDRGMADHRPPATRPGHDVRGCAARRPERGSGPTHPQRGPGRSARPGEPEAVVVRDWVRDHDLLLAYTAFVVVVSLLEMIAGARFV